MHIMLDLETWGKRPGCDIRSIGACVFDPLTGAYGLEGGKDANWHFYIACDNPETGVGAGHFIERGTYRKYPLTRDPSTVQWWNDQSAEAQAAFSNPVDLCEALKRFDAWLTDLAPRTTPDRQSPDLRIYAHGPQFDTSILEAAYHAVNLPVPWHYRAPRDTRTVFDMADVGDHSAWMQQFNHGTAHNALDDAISQARAVCAAMALVRDWQATHNAVFTFKGAGGND